MGYVVGQVVNLRPGKNHIQGRHCFVAVLYAIADGFMGVMGVINNALDACGAEMDGFLSQIRWRIFNVLRLGTLAIQIYAVAVKTIRSVKITAAGQGFTAVVRVGFLVADVGCGVAASQQYY